MPSGRRWRLRAWSVSLCVIWGASGSTQGASRCAVSDLQDNDRLPSKVVIVKLGGSSITDKARRETLNETALEWIASVLALSIHEAYLQASPKDEQSCASGVNKDRPAFLIVHGAGSFGHHTAKEFGLSGKGLTPPSPPRDVDDAKAEEGGATGQQARRQWTMQGLAQTRLSVQRLNHAVVSSLVKAGINAVAVSPCFSAAGGKPLLQAHGGPPSVAHDMVEALWETMKMGLVPVVHGDACPYVYHDETRSATSILKGVGILSGDIVVQIIALGAADAVSSPSSPQGEDEPVLQLANTVFLTDVAGVYTQDPKTFPEEAQLLRTIWVNATSQRIACASTSVEHDTNFCPDAATEASATTVDATGSTHHHDVTGGLETKLKAAIAIVAQTTSQVHIAQFGTHAAKATIGGEAPTELSEGTVMKRE